VYNMLASAVHIVAGGSITDPNSPLITKAPYKYTHHQIVAGLTVDIILTVLCLSWMVFVWYRNYYRPEGRTKVRA
jgi:hypothetical protein